MPLVPLSCKTGSSNTFYADQRLGKLLVIPTGSDMSGRSTVGHHRGSGVRPSLGMEVLWPARMARPQGMDLDNQSAYALVGV